MLTSVTLYCPLDRVTQIINSLFGSDGYSWLYNIKHNALNEITEIDNFLGKSSLLFKKLNS